MSLATARWSSRPVAVAVATAAACLALAAARPAQANPAPESWAVGKPLSAAREKLLSDGWMPQETGLTTAKGQPERERGEAGKLLEAGYPEIERCTGGGKNYCFLNYNRRGRCLRVRTLGVLRTGADGAVTTEPKVHGTGDSCPARQGKR